MTTPNEQADANLKSAALTHINPSIDTSAAGVDTGINLANTVVAIVKEVGELMNTVPYLKSLSGVILQIIKIRDHRSRKLLAKLINRGLDELNTLDRRVDELNIKLILDILVDIKLEQVATKEDQSPAPNGLGHILPPKPYLMVEREAQADSALNILLNEEPSRIAILGGGGSQSISLSVESHRMKRDPDASVLLAVLSLLPSGFPSDASALAKLEEYLGINDIDSAFQTLRTVSLVETKLSSTARIQMLSPIRLFCHEFLSSKMSSVLEKVADYYIAIMLNAEDKRWVSELYNQIVPEIQNLHSVFQRAYKAGYSQNISALIDATVFLTSWSQYIGYLARDTIQMALERSTELPIVHAKCLLALGDLVRIEGQNKKAENFIKEAATLFRKGHDTPGEARATYILGRVLLDMRQLDDALTTFKASLELYTQADYQQGQANAQYSIGQIYEETERHSEAETSLKSALEAYKKMPDLLGQSNAASSLTTLYVKIGNLTEALAAAKEAQYTLGEGNALQKLGCIFLGTDRVTEARQAFEQVLTITKTQNHYANHLGVLDDLGEALLTESINTESDAIQAAYVLATLGWLHICQGRLDKAESGLNDALQRFQEFDDKAWQVKVLAHLGTVYFKSNRLDKVEQVLESIPHLTTRLRSVEIHRLWVLGELYTVQGKFEDAQVSLDAALALCQNREYSFSYQQGNILRSCGVLLTKQGHVKLAIPKFEEAREFHRKAQWVSEQATDLDRLGEAYEIIGKIEEANAMIKEAETLMETIREAQGAI
ncbi:hypothetical protein BJ912DRAFT_1000776 [Pholiota molesta]|nr:hypothetical protein BJ912DRAFT_1000776 [Pholiota molesta]